MSTVFIMPIYFMYVQYLCTQIMQIKCAHTHTYKILLLHFVYVMLQLLNVTVNRKIIILTYKSQTNQNSKLKYNLKKLFKTMLNYI